VQGGFEAPSCSVDGATPPAATPTPQPTAVPPTPEPTVQPTAAPTSEPTPQPTTQPTPTSQPTAVPSLPGSGEFNCEISDSSVWDSGYQINVTVTNNGSGSGQPWQVLLSFPEGAQRSGGWNANFTEQGDNVVATGVSWNAVLAGGQSASFGLQGGHDGSFAEPTCSVLN